MNKDNNSQANKRLSERRKHPRFVIALPLDINFAGEHVSTITKNISCAGTFCHINKYIPQDSAISVTMELVFNKADKKIQKTITCPAKIVRIYPGPGQADDDYQVGLKFSEFKNEDKEFFLKYVRQKNLKEAKELKTIYLKLKDMAARLVEIEECHPTAEHFRQVIYRAINELDAAAHILDYEINELKDLI